MSLIPKTKHNYVGVEIEFALPNITHYRKAKYKLTKAMEKAGILNYIHIGFDHSIRGRVAETRLGLYGHTVFIRDVGIEVRVLSKEDELDVVLPKVYKVLNNLGAYVNDTCGLHVHLDMRQREPYGCAARLLDMQATILKMVHKSRRNNHYCDRREKSSQLAGLECADAGTRYAAVNTKSYRKLRTIEVRAHHATMYASEVVDWVKWLVKVVDNKAPTLKEIEYVERRIEKYA
jgi:hypothetical protein